MSDNRIPQSKNTVHNIFGVGPTTRRTFVTTGALAAAGLVACGRAPEETAMIEASTPASDFPVIVLEGSPRERGLIHGETLRSEIHKAVAVWKDTLAEDLGSDPDEYLEEFVGATSFEGAIDRWTPGLMDEVRGLAEGANLDFKTVYAYQLADEDWWYRRNKNLGVRLPTGEKCSALGVVGEDGLPTFVGQNVDLPKFYNGSQALFLVKHPDSDLQSYQFTDAGFIAACGVNNRSIGLCVNTLIQLDPSLDGLPVAFVVRGVLERTSFDDAVQFVKTVKHASGQNYTVGAPGAVRSFECSANEVVRFTPHSGGSWVCHTNHAIVNQDQGVFKEQIADKMPADAVERGLKNTTSRYDAVYNRMNTPDPKTLDVLKSALMSHDDPENPVCNHVLEDVGAFTAWSVIYELTDTPKVHFTVGPPCPSEYQTLRFEEQA
jgi:isopenicillin-N N-acyltransferase-like protein